MWKSYFEKTKNVLKDYKIEKEIFDSFWTENFDVYEKNVYILILSKNSQNFTFII